MDEYACPICSYNLQGMAETCVCPECGTACDRHAFAIKTRPDQRDWGNLASCLVVIGLVFPLARSATAPRDAVAVALVTFAALTLFYGYRILRRRLRARVWLVNHRGVWFLDDPLRRGPIPWTCIARARCSWLRQRFWIEDDSGKRSAIRPYAELGKHRLARQVVERINKAAEIYKAPPSPPVGEG